MADKKATLLKLNKNLNILKEREAKHAGNSPLDLLNQIEDHEQAIDLTRQVIAGEISEIEWEETLKQLLVSLDVFGPFSGPSIPLQRPPRAPHFIDREDELDRLLADLQPGRVVTLCGPGGIGKTALAAEAVWRPEIETRFPDGMIFHNFYNQPQANLALEHIVTSFGAEPKPTPATAALQVLAGKRTLLVLDGAEDADDLRAVLDITGGCGVLVTSRKRKDAVDERQDIPPLPTGEAVKLLQAWGKKQAADIEAAEQICKMVGWLPLAVRLVGKYLDQTLDTAAEYLAWLQETPLKALDQGRQRLDSVSILLQESLAQVSETARQVLGVVGLLALAPFGRKPVAAALGLAEGQVRQPWGELVSYGLLLRSGEGYELSHALIHTYAREKMQPEVEVVQRLAEYYITLFEAESKKGLQGYRRLDGERAHVMRVLAGCTKRGEWEMVRGLVWAVRDYLDIQGYWTERVTVLETGLKAAQKLGQRRDEGAFLTNLGNTYRNLGKVKQAIEHFEQALVIAREVGDRSNEGLVLSDLGRVYRHLGEVKRAIEYQEKALVIAREINDRHSECHHLGNLGNAYRTLGGVKRAIEYIEQALVIAREIGDQGYEGVWLGLLGRVYGDLGEIKRAIEYQEQALVIVREIGDRRSEANQLHNIGDLYKNQGNTSLARQYLEQALAIFEEIKSPDAEESRKLLIELEKVASEGEP